MRNIITGASAHRAIIAAAALVGTLIVGVRASEAQAPNAMVAQYGYQYCDILTTLGGDVHDCSFVNMAQCQASASGQGYCVENPAYIAARAYASIPAGPVPHIRRKHRH